MRFLSKALLVAAGLFSLGIFSIGVKADSSALVGSFKLDQPTQWKSTVLPAGNYTFKLARNRADMQMLTVRGNKKALDIMVFDQAACQTCQNGKLKLSVQGDDRFVSSMELPGYHVDFKAPKSTAEYERQIARIPARSEQVDLHVGGN